MKHLVNINTPKKIAKYPLLNMGFRPFFLVAGLFSTLLISAWFLVYVLHFQLPLDTININQWHAHEMIYGYSLAVIAGFLLTATKNWTGIQTLHGLPLLGLVGIWVIARISILVGMTLPAAISDLLLIALLSLSVVVPIVRSKNWKQLIIVFKLALLFAFNCCFYLGALGILQNGVYLGIYGGLFLVVGLILMLGRRVLPMFIERGVDGAVKLRQSKIIDVSSLILFLIFFVAVLTQTDPMIAAYSALLLCVVNVIRLIGWHTRGLWQKPLLWSLYLAIWSISLGFFIFYLAYAIDISPLIAIHAFAYGGIGMMTLGMMSRVALGHTGRNINHPPASMRIAFAILALGAIVRVLFCALFPAYYVLWIVMAMACWIIAFAIFIYQYYPILKNKRLDAS